MPWGWVGLAFACARFAGNGLFEMPSDPNGASLCSVPGRGVRAYVFIGFAGEGSFDFAQDRSAPHCLRHASLWYRCGRVLTITEKRR